MFRCEKGERSFGLRCEDHAQAWLSYVCRDEYVPVSAKIVEVDNNGWCVDCAGYIDGSFQIVDVAHAMEVFAEQNWERFDYNVTAMDAWREDVTFRQEFSVWLTDPATLATFEFEFDPYTATAILPVVELTADEVALCRAVLFDYSVALTVAGETFPYDTGVLLRLSTKFGAVAR